MSEPLYHITQEAVRLSALRPVSVEAIRGLKRPVLLHDHTYYEFALILSGSGRHLTLSGEYALERGSVVVLAPQEVHGYALARGGSLRLWNVYYLSEWLMADLPFLWGERHLVDLFLGRALFPRLQRGRQPEFQLAERDVVALSGDLGALQEELERATPSLIYLKSLFLKALVQLSRAYDRLGDGGIRYQFREEIWQLIHRVDEVLKSGARFDLAAEAARVGMTRDHLGRVFREATGSRPNDYFQERRIQEACVRLLDRRLNLSEIALALGFADSAHFSRAFRERRGMSPRAYRAQHR